MTPWKDGNADEVKRVDYEPFGMVSAAPGGARWYHQHFGVSKEPLRLTAWFGPHNPRPRAGPARREATPTTPAWTSPRAAPPFPTGWRTRTSARNTRRKLKQERRREPHEPDFYNKDYKGELPKVVRGVNTCRLRGRGSTREALSACPGLVPGLHDVWTGSSAPEPCMAASRAGHDCNRMAQACADEAARRPRFLFLAPDVRWSTRTKSSCSQRRRRYRLVDLASRVLAHRAGAARQPLRRHHRARPFTNPTSCSRPTASGETIDAAALGAFIEKQYKDAEVDPDEIDTGALDPDRRRGAAQQCPRDRRIVRAARPARWSRLAPATASKPRWPPMARARSRARSATMPR